MVIFLRQDSLGLELPAPRGMAAHRAPQLQEGVSPGPPAPAPAPGSPDDQPEVCQEQCQEEGDQPQAPAQQQGQ